MYYLFDFLAGLLLCYGIPHLIAGLRGERFPTPFSQPRGVGNSSALMNFLWGVSSLLIAAALLTGSRIYVGFDWGFILFLTGFILMGIHLSRHFEKVRSKTDL